MIIVSVSSILVMCARIGHNASKGVMIVAEKKNSDARIAANNRYAARVYDRLSVVVPKGKKAEIKAHVDARNESVNAFMNRAIDETIQRDKNEMG